MGWIQGQKWTAQEDEEGEVQAWAITNDDPAITIEVYCVPRGYMIRAFDFPGELRVEFEDVFPILIQAQAKGEEVMREAIAEFKDG